MRGFWLLRTTRARVVRVPDLGNPIVVSNRGLELAEIQYQLRSKECPRNRQERLTITRLDPARHGIAPFFELECCVALAKPSGAVQFQRIGAEKGDSGLGQFPWDILDTRDFPHDDGTHADGEPELVAGSARGAHGPAAA
jgi:hypothetical protein